MKTPETSQNVLDTLTPTQLKVLKKRFGLDDGSAGRPDQDKDSGPGSIPPPNSSGNSGGGAPAVVR